MFDDARSKKIIFTAHCLLNQNSISDGTADMPSQFTAVIDLLVKSEVGIVQLPCPEFICLGLARRDEAGACRELLSENTRIRKLMNEKENSETLRANARQIANQAVEYRKYRFRILGLVGIDRSPSCGIGTTSIAGREEKGRGVFMEMLAEELKRRKIRVRMIGVKTSAEQSSLEKVRSLLEE